VTGPPTRCLGDVAEKLLPVSKSEVLERHSCWRTHLNPPAKSAIPVLQWDPELAQLAERWAAQCSQPPNAHDTKEARTLPNRTTDGVSWDWVGQNICYSTNQMSWSECVDGWAEEQKDFTYGKGQTGPGQVGHYTQVVAERSKFVGCGWSYCPNKGLPYVQVCNYGPGGNMNEAAMGGVDGTLKPYTAA
jgi:hypothetical protein